MITTVLIYLNDPSAIQSNAVVVNTGSDERGSYIVVDKTPFYPSRGGQQSEPGVIQTDSIIFEVTDVRLHENMAKHYGRYVSSGTQLKTGDAVIAVIDAAKRNYHSRIHSAGELLCAAIKDLGYADWYITSAIHYEDRMNVEYNRILPENEKYEFKQVLENKINQLIKDDLPIEIELTEDLRYVKEKCGYPPEYIKNNESIRLVTVAGNTRPCMGSHVYRTSHIGEVEITKIKTRKGHTSITYSLKDIY